MKHFLGLPAVLLLFASLATAADYQFAFEFGTSGTGPGQFNRPHHVAVDSAGNLYVTDFLNDRVQKFDRRGLHLASWGGPGSEPGQFDRPIGVAVDSVDDVYVVEFRGHRVQKFSSDGKFQTQWGSTGSADGQFSFPADIAVGPGDEIFVADRSNHRIQEFTLNGDHVRTIGSQGTDSGQFQFPSGIAVSNTGALYVADEGNNRIQAFDSAGTPLMVFGSQGSGPGQFDAPNDVGIFDDGQEFDVLVADLNNDRVQVFGFDGEFSSQFSGSGRSGDMFVEPRGVTVSNDGTLFVADRSNHRIQASVRRIQTEVRNDNDDPQDNFSRSVAVSGQRVAIGVPGRLGGGAVEIFRREGNQLVFEEEIVVPPGMSASEFGQSVDLQGDILVVGAPGETAAKGNPLRAAVLQRVQTGWQFKLGLTSNQQTAGDRFGAAVAISGSMVAIGAPEDNSGSGAVYLFRVNADETATEMAKLPPPGAGGKGTAAQRFGAALAFKRGQLAAGGPGNAMANNSGIAALYDTIEGNLSAPSVMVGSAETGDSFGSAITLSENATTMLVGAPDEDSQMGVAYVFPLGGNFSAGIPVTPADRPANARFGASVALQLRRAIIGSPGTATSAKGLATTGGAFGFDIEGTDATSQDTDVPPGNTCSGTKIAKTCGDVVSYGDSAAIGDGISIVGAPGALSGEGTAFVTLDTLRLFQGGFEGEKGPFE